MIRALILVLAAGCSTTIPEQRYPGMRDDLPGTGAAYEVRTTIAQPGPEETAAALFTVRDAWVSRQSSAADVVWVGDALDAVIVAWVPWESLGVVDTPDGPYTITGLTDAPDAFRAVFHRDDGEPGYDEISTTAFAHEIGHVITWALVPDGGGDPHHDDPIWTDDGGIESYGSAAVAALGL